MRGRCRGRSDSRQSSRRSRRSRRPLLSFRPRSGAVFLPVRRLATGRKSPSTQLTSIFVPSATFWRVSSGSTANYRTKNPHRSQSTQSTSILSLQPPSGAEFLPLRRQTTGRKSPSIPVDAVDVRFCPIRHLWRGISSGSEAGYRTKIPIDPSQTQSTSTFVPSATF